MQLLMLFALVAIACASLPSLAAGVKVSGSEGEPVTIVCPQEAACQESGEYLRGFLTDRGFAVEPGFARTLDKSCRGPQWVLATQDTYASLHTGIDIPRFADRAREEAYLLDVRPSGSSAVVLLVGRSDAGLRAAVARFTCVLANYGDRLTIDARSEVSDPFVKIRAIIIGDSGRRQCPEGSPFRDIDFETWSADRLRAYPDLYWQFGFNCVQIAENRGYGSLSDTDLKRVRAALVTFAEAARKRHMLVSLDAWGDCLFHEGEAHCWNDPEQHRAMVDFIEEMGRVYGPRIDHYNIHIGDPGGCKKNGCDPSYKTSQQINAEYLRVFRKHNPKIMGAMSTWSNAGFWLHSPQPVSLSNYREHFLVKDPKFGATLPDGAKFLDETFMPKELGIALHQSYDDGQATALVEAGRPVDIWTWYIGDMEMKNNLYISMARVDEAFGKMPDSARDKLRLNSVEITFHGWPQIINSYCAAQKMWNPRRNIEEMEREFCVAGFGPRNADAVMELYQACENGPLHPIPQPADFGTEEYNRKLSAVLEKSKTISIPEGWKPNFAFPVPVQRFVDMLIARLRLTLAVSEAKWQVEAARKNGASADRIASIKADAVASLPNLPIDPLYGQDETIVRPDFREQTFAEAINAL